MKDVPALIEEQYGLSAIKVTEEIIRFYSAVKKFEEIGMISSGTYVLTKQHLLELIKNAQERSKESKNV